MGGEKLIFVSLLPVSFAKFFFNLMIIFHNDSLLKVGAKVIFPGSSCCKVWRFARNEAP